MKPWKIVKLGTLLSESRIESKNPNAKKRIRVKLNVDGIEKRPDTNDKEGATKYYIRRAGQFIYGKQNLHKGAFGIVPNELDGFESSQDIPAFDVNEECYAEWIYYFFKQGDFYLRLESLAKGIGSKRIQPKQLYDLNIYLPSKEEQRKLLNSVSSFEDSLLHIDVIINKQLALLKDFQKAIFSEAVKGDLTKKWRKVNNPKESGTDLLKKMAFSQTELIKAKKIKKPHKMPPLRKQDKPFSIPSSWAWVRYRDITEFGIGVSYGVLIPDSHTPDGVPLIRVGDLEGYEEGLMPSKYIKREIANRYKRTELKGGEVLVVVVGSTIGKSGIAHPNWKGANIARAIARTVVNEYINSKFLHLVIQSPYMQEYFVAESKSVGQPTLNINAIEKAAVPLPPLSEQNFICERIEMLTGVWKRLEEQSLACKEMSRFLQSVYLKELFGEANPGLISESYTKEERASYEDSIFENVTYFENKKIGIMELIEILNENGKMSAFNLWKMSKFENNIDEFYAELKKQVEEKKTIKESKEKGFLELAK